MRDSTAYPQPYLNTMLALRHVIAILAAGLLSAQLAQAAIYQCTPASGDTYFSNSPCRQGEQSEVRQLGTTNSISAPETHYDFEAANYKSRAFLVVHNVEDKYACAQLCRQEPSCAVATFHDDAARKRKRGHCQLRDKARNKHSGQVGAISWVK